jgi:divalent metal cation (Fe/Co/Zn/Cd) transporter
MTDLRRYAWLSVAAAIATILLKGAAWWMTGSVGLLSDAIESFVNLAGALMALWMLTLAAQPADDNHPTATARPNISPAPSRAS